MNFVTYKGNGLIDALNAMVNTESGDIGEWAKTSLDIVNSRPL